MRGARQRAGSRGSLAALTAAVVLVVALALCGFAAAAAPTLAVLGNRLVDTTTGSTFVPRGVDWPSFEYACQQGWGYSRAGTDATAVAAIAAWHITAVRVPLNQDCWLGDDGLPAYGTTGGYRAAVAQFVANLDAAGIVAILDLHWSGPGGVVADGQRAMADARSVDFWTSVASAYAASPSVMFDAFNEPYSRWDGTTETFDLTWACWRTGLVGDPGSAACAAPDQNDTETPFDGSRFPIAGMQDLVTAIRDAGASQPILLGGLDYANDLSGWLANAPADPDHALVASFHNYLGEACDDVTCWDATIAPVAAEVPVVTGELGEEDCADTMDTAYMDWADAHGVGYLAWAWWVLDTPDCHQLTVISDEAGTPAAPNGTALKAHLDALAADPGDGGGDPGGGGGDPGDGGDGGDDGGGGGPSGGDDGGGGGGGGNDPSQGAGSVGDGGQGAGAVGAATPLVTPAGAAATAPHVALASHGRPAASARPTTRTVTLRGRTLVVRVACAAKRPACHGRLTLTRAGTRLARSTLSLPAGHTRAITLTLSRAHAATVARYGHAGRVATLTITLGSRTTHTTMRLRGRR